MRETEIYHVGENAVFVGPVLVRARAELTAVVFEDYIYVFGGRDSDNKAISFVERASIREIKEIIHITNMRRDYPQHVSDFTILKNIPNPFNSSTTIHFELEEAGLVTLSLYSVTGEKLKVLEHNRLSAGAHRYVWDGTNMHGESLPTGIYFCRLLTGKQILTAKILLVK